jgi:hypothetical protein
VHKGKHDELMFTVPSQRGNTEYRSLVAYGRHIFRGCVETILRGSALASAIGLSALLTTNRERFERICGILDGDGEVEEKLKGIATDVAEIEQSRFVHDKSLTPETQLSAVQKAVSRYLETNPEEPPVVIEKMRLVRDLKVRGDLFASLTALKELNEQFEETREMSFQPDRPLRQVTSQLVETVWNGLTLNYLRLVQPPLADIVEYDANGS